MMQNLDTTVLFEEQMECGKDIASLTMVIHNKEQQFSLVNPYINI